MPIIDKINVNSTTYDLADTTARSAASNAASAASSAAGAAQAAQQAANNAVRYATTQTISDVGKATARGNIGAASAKTVDDMQDAIDCVIDAYDLTSEITIQYNISNERNIWRTEEFYASYYFELPVKSRYVIIDGNATNGTPYALLTEADNHVAGEVPKYATGASRAFVSAGARAIVEVPEDCAKIWILAALHPETPTYYKDYTPSYVAFVPDYVQREQFQAVEADVDELLDNDRREDIDLTSADILNGLISAQTGNWVEREDYESYIVEIPGNATSVQVEAGENGSVIGILKSDDLVNGAVPPYAERCKREFVGANTVGSFDIPADAVCVVILKTARAVDYTPKSLVYHNAIYATPEAVRDLAERVVEKTAGRITHAKVESEGVLNVVRRCRQLTDVKWIPAVDIPRISAILGGDILTHYEDVFKAGVEYTGVPYGQATKNCAAWGKPKADGGLKVGWGVGIDTFVSAIMTPGSCVALDSQYTASGPTHLASFYATVCTALCGYAYNLPQYYASTEIGEAPGITHKGLVANMSLGDIAIGDMVYDVAHGAIVTDRTEENGVITAIELSEATVIGCDDWNVQGSQLGGLCRRKFWSASDFLTKWSGYDVYSYDYIDDVPYTKSPYVDTGDEGEYVRVMYFPVLPYMGENFEYVAGKIVNSKILTPAYKQGVLDKLRVIKDGANWNANGTTDPYDVSGAYVVVGFTEPGEYSAYLSNAAGTIKTRSCHWTVVSA